MKVSICHYIKFVADLQVIAMGVAAGVTRLELLCPSRSKDLVGLAAGHTVPEESVMFQ